MIKEFMMEYNEMKSKYPMGSIHKIKGKQYKVVDYYDAAPLPFILTLPGVKFEKVEA